MFLNQNFTSLEIKCGFNGYYKDPNDCTKYFICFYQTPTRYR